MNYKYYGDARVATINAVNTEIQRHPDVRIEEIIHAISLDGYRWLSITPEGRQVDPETRGALLAILD